MAEVWRQHTAPRGVVVPPPARVVAGAAVVVGAASKSGGPPAKKMPCQPLGKPPLKKARMAAFTLGQRVTLLAPHAMQGKAGSILSRNVEQDSFRVRLENQWVTTVPVLNLQDAEAPTSTPADESESTFKPGQQVTLIIVGPNEGQDGYTARLNDGRVFNLTRRTWADEQKSQDARASASSELHRIDVLERKSVAMEHQAAMLHARIDRVETLGRRRRHRRASSEA